MDPAGVSESVVRDLARHRGRNDIIMDVCNSTGMDWKQAEAFVGQVEQANRQRIAGRQAPLLLVLAAIGIIGGLSDAIGIAYATMSGSIMFFPGVPIPYSGNVVYFGLGVLAIGGGLLGAVRLARELASG